jgi:mRNA interferase MazF
MTSKGFPAPFRIPVTHAAKNGLIVVDQIRSVDNIQLVKRVGAVNAKISSPDLTTLQEVFAD